MPVPPPVTTANRPANDSIATPPSLVPARTVRTGATRPPAQRRPRRSGRAARPARGRPRSTMRPAITPSIGSSWPRASRSRSGPDMRSVERRRSRPSSWTTAPRGRLLGHQHAAGGRRRRRPTSNATDRSPDHAGVDPRAQRVEDRPAPARRRRRRRRGTPRAPRRSRRSPCRPAPRWPPTRPGASPSLLASSVWFDAPSAPLRRSSSSWRDERLVVDRRGRARSTSARSTSSSSTGGASAAADAGLDLGPGRPQRGVGARPCAA